MWSLRYREPSVVENVLFFFVFLLINRHHYIIEEFIKGWVNRVVALLYRGVVDLHILHGLGWLGLSFDGLSAHVVSKHYL